MVFKNGCHGRVYLPHNKYYQKSHGLYLFLVKCLGDDRDVAKKTVFEALLSSLNKSSLLFFIRLVSSNLSYLAKRISSIKKKNDSKIPADNAI